MPSASSIRGSVRGTEKNIIVPRGGTLCFGVIQLSWQPGLSPFSVLFCPTHCNSCHLNNTSLLLVGVQLHCLLHYNDVCPLHLTLYGNYVVLPWHVMWDRTFVLAFHSCFAELLFGLYSCVCWWVICSRFKWLCLRLCKQDVSVHAFLVFKTVYVARLCVVYKAVFFNRQHYQHVVIIIAHCWSPLQRDHRCTPNHWVVTRILSERVSFLYSIEIDNLLLDAWSYEPVQ